MFVYRCVTPFIGINMPMYQFRGVYICVHICMCVYIQTYIPQQHFFLLFVLC